MGNVDIFAYKLDKVVLFYHHISEIYDEIRESLERQNVKFEMLRYSQLELDTTYLDSLKPIDTTGEGYTLIG